MKNLVIAVALAVALVLPAQAYASADEALMTTNEFRAECRKIRPDQMLVDLGQAYSAGFCRGAVWGVGSWVLAGRCEGGAVPEPVAIAQVVEIFIAYADRHPERLHEDWRHVFSDALAEAFKCAEPRS